MTLTKDVSNASRINWLLKQFGVLIWGFESSKLLLSMILPVCVCG